MAEQVQEVRTVWSWDTTDVEQATKRLERSWAREEEARKKAKQSQENDNKKNPAGGHGGGHGGTSNIGMGIHDTLMGRGTAGLFRFGNAAKLAAGYVSGVGVAMELAGKAMAYQAGEVEKTDRANERLAASMSKVAKAAEFSTVGEGAGKLGGTRETLLEQIRGERNQQSDLGTQKTLQDTDGWFYKAKDRASAYLFNSQTVEEKMTASQNRELAAGREYGQLGKKVTAAYRMDQGIAFQNSEGGDPFEARRLESRNKEETEIAAAKQSGNGSDENLALIRQKFAIQRASVDFEDRAAQRQIDGESKQLAIKKEGGAVEVASARERLRLAGKALQAQPFYTKKYYEAWNEQEKAQQGVVVAERSRNMELASHRIDLSTAGFRGNSDDRAALGAQAEVDKAREKLRILQETKGIKATEQELNEANLALVDAETKKELLRRQQAEARIALESAVRMAPAAVRAAGALLGGASNEGAQREALVQQARAAQEALAVATKRAEIEKGSVESLKAQAEAAEALTKSQLSVALHDQQVRRERRYAMQGAEGETAALRFSTSGRDDLGELAGQRAQSRIAIERANQDGHPQHAAELAEQQRLHEVKTVQDLYLNPDGSRRNPGDVRREMFQRQLKQSRVSQWQSAMDRNGGLIDVHRDIGGRIESGVDPLTGNRLNSRQIAERNAAAKVSIDNPKEQQSDAQTFTDILTVLQQRLPATTK